MSSVQRTDYFQFPDYFTEGIVYSDYSHLFEKVIVYADCAKVLAKKADELSKGVNAAIEGKNAGDTSLATLAEKLSKLVENMVKKTPIDYKSLETQVYYTKKYADGLANDIKGKLTTGFDTETIRLARNFTSVTQSLVDHIVYLRNYDCYIQSTLNVY